jgi:LacI family transcriptional regulator
LWEHRVGGLILAGGGFDQWSHLSELTQLIPQIVKSGVSVATLSPRSLTVEKFAVDNRLVGEMAARALVEKGHRRIGIILGALKNEITQQRLAGVTHVCTQNGVGFAVVHTDYSSDSGAHAVKQLLRELPGLTGLVAGSYLTAMTAISQLIDMGLSVPDDISVVGIGSLKARPSSKPQLTTVDLMLSNCGAAALDLIAARIKGHPDPEWGGQAPQFIPGTTLAAPPSG